MSDLAICTSNLQDKQRTWTDVTWIYYSSEFSAYNPGLTRQLRWDGMTTSKYTFSKPRESHGILGLSSGTTCNCRDAGDHPALFPLVGKIISLPIANILHKSAAIWTSDLRNRPRRIRAIESWNTGFCHAARACLSLEYVLRVVDTTGKPRNVIHCNSQDLACVLHLTFFTSDASGWAIRPMCCTTSP